MYFYDTCSLLNNLELIQKLNQRFIISSITIQELENIKTANYKDDEIKYKARRVAAWLKNADFMMWNYNSVASISIYYIIYIFIIINMI